MAEESRKWHLAKSRDKTHKLQGSINQTEQLFKMKHSLKNPGLSHQQQELTCNSKLKICKWHDVPNDKIQASFKSPFIGCTRPPMFN